MGMFDIFGKEELNQDTGDYIAGTSKYEPLDTDIYAAKLKLAYVDKSSGGATNINLVFSLDGSREYKETIYISGRNGKFTYEDKKTKKQKLLPGGIIVNNLCKVLTGNGLEAIEPETKVVKVYDYDLKKEVPQKKSTLTDLHDKDCLLAIKKVAEFKQEKNGNGDYVPTEEIREYNSIVNIMSIDTKQTANELLNQSDATYHDTWLEKNKGITEDKTQGTKKKNTGSSGSRAEDKSSSNNNSVNIFD